jgi:hypothetical protein
MNPPYGQAARVLEVNVTDVLASHGGLAGILREITTFITENRHETAPLLLVLDNVDDLSFAESSESLSGGVRELADCMLQSMKSMNNVWFLLGGHGLPIPRPILTVCDRTLELGIPDDSARLALIRHLLSQCEMEVDANFVLASTRGFTIGQVVRVFRLASLLIQRARLGSERAPVLDMFTTAVSLVCDSMTSSWAQSKAVFQSSGSHAPTAPTSKHGHSGEVVWPSIGGYDVVKQRLVQLVLWPLRHPEKLSAFGVWSCALGYFTRLVRHCSALFASWHS